MKLGVLLEPREYFVGKIILIGVFFLHKHNK